MRTETAHDILVKCYENTSNYKVAFENKMIGMTVLTKYNNKTYKITDVNFDDTPETTFTLKNGDVVSYIDYYKQKHKKDIKDRQQPMLISKSSERDARAGEATLLAFVPELCWITGFDDDMRKDHKYKHSHTL